MGRVDSNPENQPLPPQNSHIAANEPPYQPSVSPQYQQPPPTPENKHSSNQENRSLPPEAPQPHQQQAYQTQPPAAVYPPQQPAVAFPPPSPQKPAAATYPPQPQPVTFPPPASYQTQQGGAPQQYGPQSYNYAQNGQQQAYQQQAVNYAGQVGYQTPEKIGAQQGIPVGSQYLAPTQGWSTDLFACMDDPENALITACFPCVTFGQIAEIVDNGQTSCATSGLLYGLIAALIGIPCLMSCSYRTKIRSRYGLMESPAPDWVTHCFCEWCALCQEYRELKNQGMDPAIGWQANLAKNQTQMNQYTTMNPPTNQSMMG